MNDNRTESPYQAPTAQANEPEQPLPGDITRVGVTLLVIAGFWIVGMIANLAIYYPQAKQREDSSFPVTMCVVAGLTLAYNLVLATGAVSMLQRGSYTWSVVTCWLAVVPVLGPCWVFGIPVGIWGLVELRKPGVRESFGRRKPDALT